MSGSSQDWRSLPRRQMIRNRPIDKSGPPGIPGKCKECGYWIRLDTDGYSGQVMELVKLEDGNLYLHKCQR